MELIARLNSTTVRKYARLSAYRAAFAIGGCVFPTATAEHAARLFATPFASTRRRAASAPIDDGMRSEWVNVAGRQLAVYIWGDPGAEPYALLVHGWSSFGLRFLPWIVRLRAAGYAVVTFDQPGHGNSGGKLATLPEFARAAHAIGSRYGNAAFAVGHSLGGAALAMAQDESWQAERIVLVAPSADMIGAVDRFFRFVRLGDHLRDKFYAWHQRRTGVDARTLRVEHEVRRLGRPGLIVHDLYDRDVPWGEGERYALHWPGARLLTTQGLGHNRILDNGSVIDAAMAFARGEVVGERVQGSPGLMP